MPKKEKKKSWKERQRERQIKQQRAREAYQKQRETEAKAKPRKWPKGKIFAASCLLILIFGTYAAWQYTNPSTTLEESPSQTPIYIRADGSINTPTLSSADSTKNDGDYYYRLTADINISIVVERDNIVVDGASYTLRGTDSSDSKGIDLTGRTNVTIKNMIIKDFYYGVYLYSASQSLVSQNDLINNDYGIDVEYSSDNTISSNNVGGNRYCGIGLTSSEYNNISGNNITANSQYGIHFHCSSNNNMAENSIANNGRGVVLEDSSSNSFYHNSFVGNTYQVYDLSWEDTTIYGSINIWDDGYPSGGNYWSDYEEGYPDAEELDGSGIWNTPYVIDLDNQDNYPLVNL